MGSKIEMLRQRRGLSQGELGRLCGIPQQRLSHWEAGRGRIYLDQATALARALGVSLDYLVDEDQVEPPMFPVTERERLVWEAVRVLGADRAFRILVTRPEVAAIEHKPEVLTPEVIHPGGPKRDRKKGTG